MTSKMRYLGSYSQALKEGVAAIAKPFQIQLKHVHRDPPKGIPFISTRFQVAPRESLIFARSLEPRTVCKHEDSVLI